MTRVCASCSLCPTVCNVLAASAGCWATRRGQAVDGQASDTLDQSAFVNNAFDNRHATQIVPFFILPNATLNTPRSIGARLAFNF